MTKLARLMQLSCGRTAWIDEDYVATFDVNVRGTYYLAPALGGVWPTKSSCLESIPVGQARAITARYDKESGRGCTVDLILYSTGSQLYAMAADSRHYMSVFGAPASAPILKEETT